MAFVKENVESMRKDLSDNNRKIAESVAAASEKANADYDLAKKEVQEAYEADCNLLLARQEAQEVELNGDKEAKKAARARVKAAKRASRKEHKEATKFAKSAYLSVKFSEPNSMGFLRVIEILFILNIAFTLIALIFSSRDLISYTPTLIRDWINICLQAVALWFFIKRFRATRGMMIVIQVFNIVYNAGLLAVGLDDIAGFMFNFVLDIALLIYFICSKRVKRTFTLPMEFNKPTFEKGEFKINRRGWPFVRNLIIYFCVFSVVGHWMEMGLCQFIIMGWVQGDYDPTNTLLWRDILYPFPMEGIAVVVIALFLYPLKEWLCKVIKVPILPYVISFIANALMCTVIEFGMGLMVNADLQLWDYTNNFCNIMGQVCLQNTMAFGAAASIIGWLVYPLMERGIARIPQDIMNIAFVVIVAFYAILQFLYLVEPPSEEMATTASNAMSGTKAFHIPGGGFFR